MRVHHSFCSPGSMAQIFQLFVQVTDGSSGLQDQSFHSLQQEFVSQGDLVTMRPFWGCQKIFGGVFLAFCGCGLNENIPYGLRYTNTWFPVGSAVEGGCKAFGREPYWGKYVNWEWSLGVYSLALTSCAHSASCLRSNFWVLSSLPLAAMLLCSLKPYPSKTISPVNSSSKK